jgi:hypothetical protein
VRILDTLYFYVLELNLEENGPMEYSWWCSVVLDYLMMCKFIKPQDKIYVDLRGVIITTVWYIWCIRRQKVHGKMVQPANQLVLNIQTLVTNFNCAECPRKNRREITWMKAWEGFVPVNVDTTFNQ